MKRKNWMTSLLLSFFLGGLGVDRFYLGYTGMGLLKLFTAGGLGVLALIDFIRIATKSLQPSDGLGYEEDYVAEKNTQVVQQYSSADQLMKYKSLLDAGVITQTEFEAKKRELL